MPLFRGRPEQLPAGDGGLDSVSGLIGWPGLSLTEGSGTERLRFHLGFRQDATVRPDAIGTRRSVPEFPKGEPLGGIWG